MEYSWSKNDKQLFEKLPKLNPSTNQVEVADEEGLSIFDRVLQNYQVVIAPSEIARQERLGQINEFITTATNRIRDHYFFGDEEIEIKEMVKGLAPEKTRLEMSVLGFPELDHSFLELRRKSTMLPALVPFDLNSKDFSLHVYSRFGLQPDFEPRHLPNELKKHFYGTVEYLSQILNEKELSQISISTRLPKGGMPDDLRRTVREALSKGIFDYIFKIAEPKEWRIDEITRTDEDPMAVGWIEKTKQMFLIGLYYPTPLEAMITQLAQK